MPNTGMLDHQAFRPVPTEVRPRSVTYWMQPWPSQCGYETLRSASARTERALNFSRYLQQTQPSSNQTRSVLKEATKMPRNSVSPFQTASKPTCGYHFSRITDHRKRKIGIPPSNLVAWRSNIRV